MVSEAQLKGAEGELKAGSLSRWPNRILETSLMLNDPLLSPIKPPSQTPTGMLLIRLLFQNRHSLDLGYLSLDLALL